MYKGGTAVFFRMVQRISRQYSPSVRMVEGSVHVGNINPHTTAARPIVLQMLQCIYPIGISPSIRVIEYTTNTVFTVGFSYLLMSCVRTRPGVEVVTV